MADLKSLSPLAEQVLLYLRVRYGGRHNAVPREKIYAWLKVQVGFELTSFRAFRAVRAELIPYGAGSCESGWYLCANSVEAEQAAMYLRPHYQTIKAEMQTLFELAATMRRRETKPATIAGHQEALPLSEGQ